MSFFHENMLIGSSGQGGAAGYQIERSLRFNSADSAYLSKNFASAGNRQKFTLSWWIKRCSPASSNKRIFGYSTGTNQFSVMHDSSGAFYFYADVISPTDTVELTSSALFRDTSAWYHFVMAIDTTQATDTNRVKVWVNGTQITSWAAANWPSQNGQFYWNASGIDLRIGGIPSFYIDDYLADIHSVDGQALTPTSFGEFDTNNVWQPKAYSGTYGTNGFQLKFADNSNNTATTLGKDTSGNSNNWTPNNLSVTSGAGNDSLVDTPSSGSQVDTGLGGQVTGNYCTLNPLVGSSGAKASLSNGSLQFTNAAVNSYYATGGTFGMSSGKWYFELNATTLDSNRWAVVGIANAAYDYADNTSNGVLNAWTHYSNGGYYLNSTTGTGSGTYATGDVVMVAFDADSGKLWFGKNGTWNSGSPAAGTTPVATVSSGTYFPVVRVYTNTTVPVVNLNFGQRPFAYTAPSGFKALCTQNLPTPTITNGATAMDVALWTGNGGALTVSGYSLSPDFVWLKSRSAAGNHGLFDIVRGGDKQLISNSTSEELTQNAVTFTSNGFTSNSWNINGTTWAGWMWDAGSSTATNTSGTISSQVRSNTSAGFSVITYTGTGANATVGHGLGVAPQMVIVKRRNVAADWAVWHTSIAATNYLLLNSTIGSTSGTTYWNSTSPTSTVFSVGTATNTNANTGTYVAYCWTPVTGYSAFGSYIGNGSTDGPFIFCNFRPRFILIKSSSLALDWCIFDTARDGYNADNDSLYPNSSQVENNFVLSSELDILSNGFKPRANRDRINQSAATYVWAAFAEHPFALARAR